MPDEENNLDTTNEAPGGIDEEAEKQRESKRPRISDDEPKKSLFGGGVPAFGGGFASIGSGKSSSAFGGGGFASFSAETSTFGSGGPLKIEPTVFGGKTEDKEEEVPSAEAAKNGEEGEACLARYRAKLYVLGHVDEELSWRERGIGQVRVLEKDDESCRIVMRREQTHSLVLNTKLAPKHATVAKHAENAIRLVAVTSESAATTYLLKVKLKEDRDKLFDLLQQKTALAAAAVGEAHESAAEEEKKENHDDDDGPAAATLADENA